MVRLLLGGNRVRLLIGSIVLLLREWKAAAATILESAVLLDILDAILNIHINFLKYRVENENIKLNLMAV